MILKYKQSFSILELIFIVVIVGILATVSIPKLSNTTKTTSLVKLKNELNLINDGIKQYQTKAILQGDDISLDSLDEDDINLFSKVLTNPIISSSDINSWSKISNNSYRYRLNSNDDIVFVYDKDDLTFSCDKTLDICKEILK